MAKSYGSPRLRVENLWIILDLSAVFMRKNRFLARVQHSTSSMTPLWVTTADLWMDSGHTLGPLGRRSTISGQHIYIYISISISDLIFFCSSRGFKHVQTHVQTHVRTCLSMFIPFSQLLYLARPPVKLRWTSLDVVFMGPYDISNSMNIDESSMVSRTNTPIFVDCTNFTGKFNQIYSPRAKSNLVRLHQLKNFKWLRATPNFATSIWKNRWISSILVSCK